MISNKLITAVLRQAFSRNMVPASVEFDDFITERLWQPYCKDAKYENRTPDKQAIFRAGCDQRLIQMMQLEKFWKHCRRNKGLNAYIVGQQLGVGVERVYELGEMCVQLEVSARNPVNQFLDGVDIPNYSPESGEILKDNRHVRGAGVFSPRKISIA